MLVDGGQRAQAEVLADLLDGGRVALAARCAGRRSRGSLSAAGSGACRTSDAKVRRKSGESQRPSEACPRVAAPGWSGRPRLGRRAGAWVAVGDRAVGCEDRGRVARADATVAGSWTHEAARRRVLDPHPPSPTRAGCPRPRYSASSALGFGAPRARPPPRGRAPPLRGAARRSPAGCATPPTRRPAAGGSPPARPGSSSCPRTGRSRGRGSLASESATGPRADVAESEVRGAFAGIDRQHVARRPRGPACRSLRRAQRARCEPAGRVVRGESARRGRGSPGGPIALATTRSTRVMGRVTRARARRRPRPTSAVRSTIVADEPAAALQRTPRRRARPRRQRREQEAHRPLHSASLEASPTMVPRPGRVN